MFILNSIALATYRGEAAAHVGVRHREAGLVDGLLEDQVDDALQPLLRVDGQVRHLLHQLVELLRRQLVEDAADLPEELLRTSRGEDEPETSAHISTSNLNASPNQAARRLQPDRTWLSFSLLN